ncbi:MAG: hypothetical protein WC998_00815 [Candidatus Paceibacterota bacterium]
MVCYSSMEVVAQEMNDDQVAEPEFAEPVSQEALYRIEVAEIISSNNPYNVDVEDITNRIVSICYLEYNQNPVIWTYIAFKENEYRTWEIGGAGERSIFQIHPVHKKKIKEYGLHWDDHDDLMRFGCCMVQERLDNGRTLYQAYKPWSVRYRAFQLYKKHQEEKKDGD